MIKVYTGFKGFGILLFLIGGLFCLGAVFFWGIAKAAGLLLPFLTALSDVFIVIFVGFILPASLFKQLRPRLARYALVLAALLAISTWMIAFFYIYKDLGATAVFLGFFMQFFAPIALIGALIKGAWVMVGQLFLWIVSNYVMKAWSRSVLTQNKPQDRKGNVIDVEILEQV